MSYHLVCVNTALNSASFARRRDCILTAHSPDVATFNVYSMRNMIKRIFKDKHKYYKQLLCSESVRQMLLLFVRAV